MKYYIVAAVILLLAITTAGYIAFDVQSETAVGAPQDAQNNGARILNNNNERATEADVQSFREDLEFAQSDTARREGYTIVGDDEDNLRRIDGAVYQVLEIKKPDNSTLNSVKVKIDIAAETRKIDAEIQKLQARKQQLENI